MRGLGWWRTDAQTLDRAREAEGPLRDRVERSGEYINSVVNGTAKSEGGQADRNGAPT